jgi:hypothetical protein
MVNILIIAVVGLLIMLMQVRVHRNSYSQNAFAEKGKDTIAQCGDAYRAYIAHDKNLDEARLAFIKLV